MNILVFNLSMALAWLMFLAGGVMFDPAIGLMASAALLIVIVLLAVRVAGGVFQPQQQAEGR